MKQQSLPIVPRIGVNVVWLNTFCRCSRPTLATWSRSAAAALYFLKTPSKTEVINDINGELVNLYRVVKHHLEEFVRQFKWALVSRQIFKWLQDTPEETLTDIQRAARFYYLQKQAFGGKVAEHTFGTSTTSAPRFNLLRIEEELSMAPAPVQNADRTSGLAPMHREI